MKKITLALFLIASIFLNPKSASASHLWGGEISWDCLSNGMFIFKMNIYRECTGINFPFNNKILTIYGTSKPRGANNQIFNSIILKPDSAKWLSLNQTIMNQTCDTGQAVFNCQNRDVGAFEVYPYVSDPIQLKGTPSFDGWTFFWTDNARPSEVINGPSGNLGLRAIMYPIKNPNSTTPPFLTTDQCQDASPRFAIGPKMFFCWGMENNLNMEVRDSEIDSLAYDWDRPLTNSPTSYANYTSPYTFASPFPGTSFNSRNIPANLDPKTGNINFAIYNGSGYVAFSYVVRVDAFRQGQKISSTFWDNPILVGDCPLPTGMVSNNPPEIEYHNSNTKLDTVIDVFADGVVNISFSIFDRDSVLNNNPPFQQVSFEPSSVMFSTNFSSQLQCISPLLMPCATLNPPPIRSATGKPYIISGPGGQGVATTFNWQTSCGHLSNGAGSNNGMPNSYQFVLKSYDDFCPNPSSIYPTITVNVKPKSILEASNVKGASVGFDGKITVNWVPPIDSSNSFEKYDIQASSPNNTTNPAAFLDVQLNIRKYKQEQSFPFFNFGPNLWTPIPAGKDYYFRMRTKSGCSQEEPSTYSESARVIEINTQAIGSATPNNKIKLTWNAPKASNVLSPNYYVYESPTHYYIWQNDNANNNITDLNNWYLRGSTKSKTIDLPGNACNLVAFRVEARDTVITYKQGSSILKPNYDTLTFSTYSIINVSNMVIAKPEVEDHPLISIQSNVNSQNLQWFNCNTNSIISGENNQTFIPKDTGRYAVILGSGTCIDTSACFQIDELLDNTVSQITNQQLRSNGNMQLYQWIDCRADTLIPGATNQNYFPSDTGYYAVIVSAYGYSDTSNCIPMLAIGIQEKQFESSLKIYPNPTTDQVFIQSDKLGLNRIVVRNINGQLIQDIKLHGVNYYEIQLDVKQGIYIFELESISGSKAYRKIIKQ